MTFTLERDVAADTGDVATVLLDPTLLGRCVPGASLTAAGGSAVTGRIRIKQTAVPSVYALQGELSHSEGAPDDTRTEFEIVTDGFAEDQRTGRRFGFRIRVALTPSGPGRSWCRVVAELSAGDDAEALLERLTPQFIRRLEDVALEVPEISALESSMPTSPEPEQSPAPAMVPKRWVANAGVVATVAVATAAAVLLAWGWLRRRHRTGTTRDRPSGPGRRK